jgi:hypothetical protein
MLRQNLEEQALRSFEEVAHRYGYPVVRGQGGENRIAVRGNTYFQFGDLRVDTAKHHIVVEVESAGGLTNLVKYWYCLEDLPGSVKMPIALLHIFRQASAADYGSHLALWDFVSGKMTSVLGNERIRATCYTYRDLAELEPAIDEFENHLKRDLVSIP